MSLKERLFRFRSFWIFPLLSILLLYFAFRDQPGNLPSLFWLFPSGLFAWTLIEYGLHRFVFHIGVRNRVLREIVNASHLRHHSAPRDPDTLLVRTAYGSVISALIFGGLYLTLGRFDSAVGMLSGIWAGFLYYESVHYRVHLTASNTGIISRQRRAHFHHHFTNDRRCFGVTSPLWDYVFGTRLPTKSTK